MDNIVKTASTGSVAEDRFIEIFCLALGPENTKFLYTQHPFVDIYGNNRFIDFALETDREKIAIEIDGESYHNPKIVSDNKYQDDLLKQNSLIYNGWKIYRWTYNELVKNKERVRDELLTFFSEIENFKLSEDFLPKQQGKIIELRGYQEEALASLEEMRKNKETIGLLYHATGIGKTISTIYPALKSLIYEDNEKIFYLTSKTINREAASDTLMLLKDAGLRVRAIALTAKDKICPYGSCDLNTCDYARGHFDRINSAIYDILETQDIITRDVILSYSESHKVCPFEFALDISLFCDVIIGDYNYAFDPAVYLKRFFAEQMGKYIFLMDEAHNFIDRARDMFSASIEKTAFLDLRKLIKSAIKDHTMIPKELSDVLKSIGHVNAGFLKLKPEQAEIEFSQKALPENLVKAIRGFIENSDYYFSEYPNANEEAFYQDLLSLYFEAHAFIRIAELYDERYTMLGYQYDKNLRIKLFCIDPSALVKDALSRCTSLIAFSATLIPASYYISMMGGLEDAVYLMLDSPFNPERLKVMIDSSVSTRYSHRQRSIDRVVQRIHSAVSAKNGNYIAFFPSYEYMNQIYEEFSKAYEEIECIVQERSFTELQREDFLKQFVDQNTHVMVGFAVMGGAFSEGIDLKGDRLSGAIIATVGLPGISYELDLIMEYFNNEGKNGFDYAYRYQGMNKVMQSAGRVIRTSSDKGFILLLDDRFLEASYQNLMPREWLDFERVSSPLEIKTTLDKFWQEEK